MLACLAETLTDVLAGVTVAALALAAAVLVVVLVRMIRRGDL